MNDFINPDLERSVLGCSMGGRAAMLDLVAVKPEHFTDVRHAALWRLITQMDETGQTITVQTVAANLGRIPENERHGIDSVWLFDSYQMGTPVIMAEQLSGRLRELAQLRRLQLAVGRSSQILEGATDAGSALETIRDLIDSAEPDGPQGHMMGDEIDDVVNSFSEKTVIYETPWPSLNELIQGWRPGGLYVVGARPGVGKSILGLQAALALANLGPVAVNSLEMARREVYIRVISQYTGIPQNHLGGLRPGFNGPSNAEWDAIGRELEGLRMLPVSVDDRTNISVMDVRAHARSLTRRGKIAGVVVDYLQLMSVSGNDRRPRHEVVAEQSRQLKILAKELECPVIALSQLNRASETREGKAPSLADLRESGSIEQDADAVLLLHVPDVPDVFPPMPDHEKLIVTVAKNRQGTTGRKTLYRDGATACLLDLNQGN